VTLYISNTLGRLLLLYKEYYYLFNPFCIFCILSRAYLERLYSVATDKVSRVCVTSCKISASYIVNVEIGGYVAVHDNISSPSHCMYGWAKTG
jgi:hypothetical protein